MAYTAHVRRYRPAMGPDDLVCVCLDGMYRDRMAVGPCATVGVVAGDRFGGELIVGRLSIAA